MTRLLATHRAYEREIDRLEAEVSRLGSELDEAVALLDDARRLVRASHTMLSSAVDRI